MVNEDLLNADKTGGLQRGSFFHTISTGSFVKGIEKVAHIYQAKPFAESRKFDLHATRCSIYLQDGYHPAAIIKVNRPVS